MPAAPATRLATVRILVGTFATAYLAARLVHFGDYRRLAPEQFRPIGIATVCSAPLPAMVTWSIAIATLLLAIVFTLGVRYRVAAPLFAACLLWVTTYRSSWGMIFHTENLLVLHVMALALTPAADRYAWGVAPRDDGQDEEHAAPQRRYGWPLVLLGVITVLTYLVAGVTKLRQSGLEWVTSDLLRNYVAYDALRKIELGSTHSPLGAGLVLHGWLFKPFAGFSLAIELLAPLALLSPRLARPWIVCALGFHVGVLAVMAIFFPYPLFGIAFASFLPVERMSEALRQRVQRRARR
jgi:hypothetical protein